MDSIIIIISDKKIYVKDKKDNKLFDFSEFRVNHSDISIYSDFIIETLKKFYKGQKNLVLIPDECFTETITKYSKQIKSSVTDFPPELRDNCSLEEVNNKKELEIKKVIQKSVALKYKNQLYRNFGQIPVLSTYYVKTTEFIWKEILSTLYKKLTKSGYNIQSVAPFGLLESELLLKSAKHHACISIFENASFLSFYENGIVTSQDKVSFGYRNLVEKVSDYYNISIKISRELVEKYGFVFLPSKYSDFVVDLPIYQDIIKEIELPELSYIIREECKIGIEQIFKKSSQNNKTSIFLENAAFYSDFKFRGMQNLLEMVTGGTFSSFDLSEFSQEDIIVAINNLKINYCDKVILSNLETACEDQKSGFLGAYKKAKQFFNNQMNQHLVDDSI